MRFRRNRVSEWRGLNRVISMIERPKKASDAMLRYVTSRGFGAEIPCMVASVTLEDLRPHEGGRRTLKHWGGDGPRDLQNWPESGISCQGC